MKKLSIIGATVIAVSLFAACGGNGNKSKNNSTATKSDTSSSAATATSQGAANPTYDPHRGEGKFTNYVPGPVNPQWVTQGKSIYEQKCQGCHKLTSERLVGPGWKGITDKHSGAWILNFVTNTDEMLSKDPELQKQIEICMVRMPNQNLTDQEAKEVYDFMRQNDGKK